MGEEGTPKTEMINPALLDGVSANFIVKGPSGIEKAYPMRAITVTIGRSDQCDIAVKDSSMSGRHAEISKINGEIRVRDMGSANGIWLNGERVDDVELFDGDVLRLGQTSIRVDVVGGRKRPDAGLNPKVLAGIIAGVLVLAGAGIAGGLYLKKRAQTKRDRATLTAFIAAARESQKSNPCAVAVDKLADVQRIQNNLGKPVCGKTAPKGEDARRVVGGYRDLARTYDRIVVSLSQFAAQFTSSVAALTGSAEQIADPGIKERVAEAQELIEQRNQIANSLISDWKKLSLATNNYATAIEQALVQGNPGACADLDRVMPRTPTDVQNDCKRNFKQKKDGVEDKLKELDEVAGGAPAE